MLPRNDDACANSSDTQEFFITYSVLMYEAEVCGFFTGYINLNGETHYNSSAFHVKPSEVRKIHLRENTTRLFVEVNSSSLLKEFALTNEMKLSGTDYLKFS
jgi:hypothetical protein